VRCGTARKLSPIRARCCGAAIGHGLLTEQRMGEHVGFWQGILDVASGRGQLRLILQPVVAIIFGARLGISDAKERNEPFFLRLFLAGRDRTRIAKQAASDVIVPFSVAVVLDGILQYLTFGYVRPLAAIVVGAILIEVPYSISRALANRVYRRTRLRRSQTPSETTA
jgi:hypothetical protein